MGDDGRGGGVGLAGVVVGGGRKLINFSALV